LAAGEQAFEGIALKTRILFLVVGVLAVAAVRLQAQILQTLFSFSGGTNGAWPYSSLIIGRDDNFYGTTWAGGPGNSDYGTVFRITTNGTLNTIASFNATGGSPYAQLTQGNDGNFYGTTVPDATGGWGTVFKLTSSGTLTTLVSFSGTNGGCPYAALTLGPDGNFYGTTAFGGNINSSYPNGCGTVFKVTTNGALTTLYSFSFADGAYPDAALTLGNDGNFYGTTWGGGSTDSSHPNGCGTVFSLTTNGALTTLFSFADTNGANPLAALTLNSDGSLYGTTEYGGQSNDGTVFKVTTNGVLTTLICFADTNGANPYAALTLGTDCSLYGTTFAGGSDEAGTLFRVTTNGTFTTLVSFMATTGDQPRAALILGSDGNFYGTSSEGGSGYDGTVFRLLPFTAPDVSIQPQTQTVTVGNPAVFNTSTYDALPLSYQWLFNGTNILDATNSALTVSNAFPANQGLYVVVVTNLYGSVTSAPAMLTVSPLPLSAPQSAANGQFQFSFDTVTGVNYTVQYSASLSQADWIPLLTFEGYGGPITVIDPNAAGSSQRFYRVALSPSLPP
jgi:uncharacterized repeat protein (TIGR03803 family)